jgi:hypothetical protein
MKYFSIRYDKRQRYFGQMGKYKTTIKLYNGHIILYEMYM